MPEMDIGSVTRRKVVIGRAPNGDREGRVDQPHAVEAENFEKRRQSLPAQNEDPCVTADQDRRPEWHDHQDQQKGLPLRISPDSKLICERISDDERSQRAQRRQSQSVLERGEPCGQVRILLEGESGHPATGGCPLSKAENQHDRERQHEHHQQPSTRRCDQQPVSVALRHPPFSDQADLKRASNSARFGSVSVAAAPNSSASRSSAAGYRIGSFRISSGNKALVRLSATG